MANENEAEHRSQPKELAVEDYLPFGQRTVFLREYVRVNGLAAELERAEQEADQRRSMGFYIPHSPLQNVVDNHLLLNGIMPDNYHDHDGIVSSIALVVVNCSYFVNELGPGATRRFGVGHVDRFTLDDLDLMEELPDHDALKLAGGYPIIYLVARRHILEERGGIDKNVRTLMEDLMHIEMPAGRAVTYSSLLGRHQEAQDAGENEQMRRRLERRKEKLFGGAPVGGEIYFYPRGFPAKTSIYMVSIGVAPKTVFPRQPLLEEMAK